MYEKEGEIATMLHGLKSEHPAPRNGDCQDDNQLWNRYPRDFSSFYSNVTSCYSNVITDPFYVPDFLVDGNVILVIRGPPGLWVCMGCKW